MKFASLLLLPILLFASAHAQSPCPPGDAAREAMLPLGLQNNLLAHKIAGDDFELDAPADVSRDIVMLRKTLDVATQAFFHCEAGDDSDPGSLQSKLSAFLHVKRSQHDESHDRADGIYGANLRIKVDTAKGLSNSVFVTLTFGIECGDDNILLLFTKETDQWRERLHWYSDKYTKPSDAFGDLYLYSSVTGQDSTPLVAIAHGHPWCTSRWSGFDIDLLRPATKLTSQVMLDHFSAGYDRNSEEDQGIKLAADGFTFKFWTNEAVPAKDPTQMSGPLTLRFRTTANTLKCVSKDCPKK
ncbi:MAG TPA: hypothetical protein VF865_03300 [Acidobacteriaceae bacterium]